MEIYNARHHEHLEPIALKMHDCMDAGSTMQTVEDRLLPDLLFV